MDNIKQIKTNRLSKVNKISKLKRPFSIEKIAKSINCGNMINSIKYKYIDPKIKRNKKIIPMIKITSKKKIQDKLDEEMYSARKIKYRKYKLIKESLLTPLSYREIKKDIKNQNNDFILPLIIKNKKINERYKEIKKEENDFISTSGMINRKMLNDNKKSKITISSLINVNKNNFLMGDKYKSLDNIHQINEIYNLNLDLKKNNLNIKNKLKRKLTKFGLLTNLFHKYSSVNNINSNDKKMNNKKNEEKVDYDEYSSNISFDLGKELSLVNNNYAGGSTFLTKLKDINDNIDISNIINRHNNLIWSIKKNNNKIIDKDKNIYINCLLSKVKGELERDKIMYKNNGKTIYELDKEWSYKRIKKFENIINKFIGEKD